MSMHGFATGAVFRIGLVVLGTAFCATSARALSNVNDFCTGDPCIISSAKTADPGITLDFGTRDVRLTEILSIGTLPTGNVGSLTILAGSFTIINNGQIKGTNGTNQAGSLDINTSGDMHLDGTRATGALRLTGADGGNVNLVAGGSIYASGKINIDHDGLPAGGGSLTATANGGVIDISGDIIAEGGVQGYGGSIDLQATGDIDLSGQIDISGGESGGGFIDIFGFASVTIGPMELSAGGDSGDAGLVDITAIGDITINGLMRGNGADNGENCGDAGDVDITADGNITISAPVEMKGRGLDCSGGYLSLDGDAVTITAPVTLEGTGTEGFGGDLDFASASAMLIIADLNNSGGDGAGDVLIDSDTDLFIIGDILANGRTVYSTGTSLLEIDSSGTIYYSGQIDAHGGSLGAGGDVSLDGCSVTTAPGTLINTTGPGGLITILGSDAITLAGSFQGEPTTPSAIEIRYGATVVPNIVGATFNVPPTLVLNPFAIPCSLCSSNAECDDSNPCTDDVCVLSVGCENNANSNPCEDGNLCTVGDVCSGGNCTSGSAVVCSDGNPCTDDTCVPATGCEYPNNTLPCDDGDLCTTGDQCSGGSCNGAPLDCEDGNPCTTNSCSAGFCQSVDNNDPCEDGDLCTDGDTCSGGTCNGGPPLDCDDMDPCTTDSCAPVSGCSNEPIAACGDTDNDGIPDSEDPCTTLDWTATPIRPPNQHPSLLRLNLKKLIQPGENQLLLKGFFNVAAPAQPVAPEINGAHLQLSDSAGVLYEVNVPGGLVGEPQQCGSRDGWSVAGNSSKPRWKYANKSGALPPSCTAGSAHGLQYVQIKDLRAASKSALQIKVKAKHSNLDHFLAMPLTLLRADLALAAQPSPGVASQQAIDGQCAEGLITGSPIAATAPAPFCKAHVISPVIDKLTCKGP